MKKIFLKLFLASFPILIVLSIYFYFDPFKVLYNYDSYFPKDGVQAVTLNKDFVSTEMFVKNYRKYKYDSYIFGNSRSMYYHIDEWSKHVGSDRCFHFDASGESIYGIERKIQFLHDRNVVIKNALILFEYPACRITKNVAGYMATKHPLLIGQSNFDFQLMCIKNFFDVDFLYAYVFYLCTRKISKQDKSFLSAVNEHYDPSINEQSFPAYEAIIAKNRDSFYLPRTPIFYKRYTIQQYAPHTIKEEQKKIFKNMQRILALNNTNYKIVISPTYDQLKFDTTDLAILQLIFGKNHIYDFSGINNITQDKYNYYEDAHYRPFVANWIMDSIYNTRN